MPVDYAEAWLKLKAFVASKPHHGQRDLFAAMVMIEVESPGKPGHAGYEDGADERRDQGEPGSMHSDAASSSGMADRPLRPGTAEEGDRGYEGAGPCDERGAGRNGARLAV
jgi:hypothetical protein